MEEEGKQTDGEANTLKKKEMRKMEEDGKTGSKEEEQMMFVDGDCAQKRRRGWRRNGIRREDKERWRETRKGSK